MTLTPEKVVKPHVAALPRVFSDGFKGAYQAYQKIIDDANKVIQSPQYSREHKIQVRQDAKTAIKALYKEAGDKAREVLNSIRDEHTPKPAAKPTFEPTVPIPEGIEKYPATDKRNILMQAAADVNMAKIAYQLERQNSLVVWQARMATATPAELAEMHKDLRYHQNHDDWKAILKVELARRGDSAELSRLKVDLDHEVDMFPEFKQIESVIALFSGGETVNPDAESFVPGNADTGSKLTRPETDLAQIR
jgi:hypothetical protein